MIRKSWDRINALEYDTNLSLDKSIALLQKKYLQRSENNLSLKFLQEDIDNLKIQNQNTRLSLNLDIRKNERELKKALQLKSKLIGINNRNKIEQHTTETQHKYQNGAYHKKNVSILLIDYILG